jgi:MoaA/NifB/PqqE/SkfB family radical SAM enzyme
VVDDAAAAGVQEVGCFYLGESFSNPELLVWAIGYAKTKVPYVFLTTNGSLAKPEHLDACMAAGLDSLKFSINASDVAQFEAIMGVKAKNYHKALDNLKAARELRDEMGYATRISASYIAYDGEHRQAMQKLLDEQVRPYADDVYALPLYGMSLRADEIEAATGYKPTHGNMGRLDEETGLPTRP